MSVFKALFLFSLLILFLNFSCNSSDGGNDSGNNNENIQDENSDIGIESFEKVSSDTESTLAKYSTIRASDINSLLDPVVDDYQNSVGTTDFMLVDVRSSTQFNTSRIPFSISIPTDTLLDTNREVVSNGHAVTDKIVSKDQQVIVYCFGDNNPQNTDSHYFANAMIDLGYTDVYVYGGGFSDWIDSGYFSEIGFDGLWSEYSNITGGSTYLVDVNAGQISYITGAILEPAGAISWDGSPETVLSGHSIAKTDKIIIYCQGFS